MNSETGIDFLKKGFHMTLGATTSLVEALQDPLKREETLAQWRLGPNELAEFLAQKGAVTEVEARNFVDGVVAQYGSSSSTTNNASSASPYPTPVVDLSLQQDLRDLTAQLAELRSQLHSPGNS
jgi:polyhydroxyalkanoate synthesis regulator phasin